ncbi:MAG: polyprenyl synthetase family protein [Paludibacteraceae bacterium]
MTPDQLICDAIRAICRDKQPAGLYEPITYVLEAGGKRLRPLLTLIAAEMYGTEWQKVLPAALAIEVFHNFTLMHDDVMDKAPIRRGKPTVHVRWNTNTAILSGDQMLIEAYKQLAQLPANKLPRVLQMFNEMATGICEGQQYDVDFETATKVTIDDYIHMIRLKTSVLLATALKTGAYMADAPEEEQELLYDYGINIGLAFQLQDDILDVYGNPATFGKATGGDIIENKKTYMYLTALQQADDATLRELQRWFDNKEEYQPQEKIEAVRAIYTQLGIKEICEDVMRKYTEQAFAILDKIKLPAEKKLILRELGEHLLARKE